MIIEDFKKNSEDADEELIGILMAISVTAKSLAKKFIRLSQTDKPQKGGQ